MVSVIICFYNDERFLGEAIQSVVQQEFSDWEILLVDDGSTDNSSRIAMKFSNEDSRIKYFEHSSHQNKGLSESRNLGIANATGELITFLDSDDIYLPSYLSKQVELMNQYPDVSMICEATLYWYSWRDSSVRDKVITIGAPQDRIYSAPELATILYPLGKGDAPCTCGTIIRRTVLNRHGGFEPMFTGMYEDQAFLIKIYLNEKVLISSNCNNWYRQRGESMMNTANREGKYHAFRRMFLEWLKQYLDKSTLRDPGIQKLHAMAYSRYKYPALYKVSRFITNRVIRGRTKTFLP